MSDSPQVAEKKEIETVMGRLDSVVEEAVNRFDSLAIRLSPVTKPTQPEQPPEDKTDDMPETGLGQQINESVRRLEGLLSQIQSVYARLEL